MPTVTHAKRDQPYRIPRRGAMRETVEAAHRGRLLLFTADECGAEVAMTMLQCFIIRKERNEKNDA